MKFILSSKVFGNSNATNKFRQFIRKPLSELKLLLIASHCLPYGIKSYWDNDKYLEELIDDSLDFKSLNDLLDKNILKI